MELLLAICDLENLPLKGVLNLLIHSCLLQGRRETPMKLRLIDLKRNREVTGK